MNLAEYLCEVRKIQLKNLIHAHALTAISKYHIGNLEHLAGAFPSAYGQCIMPCTLKNKKKTTLSIILQLFI